MSAFEWGVITLLLMIFFTLVFTIAPVLERIAAREAVDLDKVLYQLENIRLASRHLESIAVDAQTKSQRAWGG